VVTVLEVVLKVVGLVVAKLFVVLVVATGEVVVVLPVLSRVLYLVLELAPRVLEVLVPPVVLVVVEVRPVSACFQSMVVRDIPSYLPGVNGRCLRSPNVLKGVVCFLVLVL
jgi:hypothetical protein